MLDLVLLGILVLLCFGAFVLWYFGTFSSFGALHLFGTAWFMVFTAASSTLSCMTGNYGT